MATSLKTRAPDFSAAEAADLARMYYRLDATASALASERDQNFLLTARTGERYVLKLAQAGEEVALLQCQNDAIDLLANANTGYAFPVAVPGEGGERIIEVTGSDGRAHWMRLVLYIPGEPIAHVRPHSVRLLHQVGALFGVVDRVLQEFRHPAAARDLYWDVRNGPAVIDKHIGAIADPTRRRLVESMRTAMVLSPNLTTRLRRSVIHNDGNDHNLIVRGPTRADLFEPASLLGLIDFGDLVDSWTIAEVAVAATYAMLDKVDPLAAATHVVAGYHAELPIEEHEIEAIFPLICTRLCMSVVLAAAQRSARPENEYLSISEAPAWVLLEQLSTAKGAYAHFLFRAACGLEPSPSTARVNAWLRDPAFKPAAVLPDHDLTRAHVLDLSVPSLEFGEVSGRDVGEWSAPIEERVRDAGATVGIGRYDEARAWYTTPAFRVETDAGPEWRTLHMGIDLFAPAGTAVAAPLEGIIESVQDNAQPLDYGPTVILRHEPVPRVRFYTLYGHLSRASTETLRPGQAVGSGERFAALGAPLENGGWPPHLHLQLITDLLGNSGDFPGVARPSERALMLSVSPDPNLLLRLPHLTAAARPARDALLAERRARIGPSLSIAYRSPLVIVRGARQFLYDQDGQRYLDAVNNVAHVGHSHPRVVDALRRQAAVLNTNTRYLNELLTRFAERLTATLPETLSVCYFVCSGSEANELALRLARTHTGGHDVIVIDAAYHGNTSALIELSPYKFKGPGGMDQPAHVQVVPLPDRYRGAHRGCGREAGVAYAQHVRSAIERVQQRGRGLAAFFAESLPGCGGQIVPPEGYLAESFAYVRAAGGVCVADEVQTGLGRVGSHFWAFETQGVVPDVVTVGKPLGNGHPIGAVITTPEIAASFDNGMEYFNTFGGNPVSCAVGLAVLDVIADERLQDNALRVGDRLLAGLNELRARYALIGDVRGLGLYIGVELVLDRATRDPAGACASYVANRMREHGILISTDGPDHNVLKIKPPLVFKEDDAHRLVSVLGAVLDDTALAGE